MGRSEAPTNVGLGFAGGGAPVRHGPCRTGRAPRSACSPLAVAPAGAWRGALPLPELRTTSTTIQFIAAGYPQLGLPCWTVGGESPVPGVPGRGLPLDMASRCPANREGSRRRGRRGVDPLGFGRITPLHPPRSRQLFWPERPRDRGGRPDHLGSNRPLLTGALMVNVEHTGAGSLAVAEDARSAVNSSCGRAAASDLGPRRRVAAPDRP